MNKSTKFNYLGLGGTFDHFHAGHAWFLTQAARLSQRLIVGVTLPQMTSAKPYASSLEPYDLRSRVVAAFLNRLNVEFEIVPLTSSEGPTLTDQRIEAVAVTPDTLAGGERINRLRLEHGLPLLHLEVLSLKHQANQTPLSSSSIRAGQNNRIGSTYSSVLTQTLRLNEQQKQALRPVRGTLVDRPVVIDPSRYLVGDSTLERFLQLHLPYDLALIDGKMRRTAYTPLVIDPAQIDLTLVNPAGAISQMLSQGVALALHQQLRHIFVDGEEDLAAVVLQLLLPLGAVIYYGQPDQGLVRYAVTEAEKEDLALLLDPHFQTNPKLVE